LDLLLLQGPGKTSALSVFLMPGRAPGVLPHGSLRPGGGE
jgi:hypothetical protein